LVLERASVSTCMTSAAARNLCRREEWRSGAAIEVSLARQHEV
jgi:hypothetical protein